MNREFGPFGSIAYAKEELRAEIGSMMISGELGIGQSVDDHAAYVQSWIKILRDDPREVFRAAADAEKIMDYVMEFEHTQELGQEHQSGLEKNSLGMPEQEVELHVDMQEHQAEATRSQAAASSNNERVYLNVPFKQKEEAKALGAQWDRQKGHGMFRQPPIRQLLPNG